MTTVESAISDAHTAMPLLAGRKAMVTGGTLGIGRAVARLLALCGTEIFLFSRDSSHVSEALASLRELGAKATGMVGDVARPKDIAKVFGAAKEELSDLDVLVANAGISGEAIADMPDEDWQYVMATNLIGAMATAREALAWMERRKSGHIVLIGSMSAEREGKAARSTSQAKAVCEGLPNPFTRKHGKRASRFP